MAYGHSIMMMPGMRMWMHMCMMRMMLRACVCGLSAS